MRNNLLVIIIIVSQELLELLTRRGRAVRMIPIPVSRREARYIDDDYKNLMEISDIKRHILQPY